ncbi:glycoside hydrolase family 3 N-terminal domain-containing protein, partial [Paralimibaculum aggregatum]|uniref:glycoside hydrolase family 3 N-terminal domain-containing protein n=1 Tax=Paralimibaculum aggregatum TaxID=3036245 RepID=UPI002553BF71
PAPAPAPGSAVVLPPASGGPVALLPAPTAGPVDVDGPALRQMVGQMLVLGFQGRAPGDPGVERVAGYLGQGLLGGVLIMGHNVTGKAQVRRLVQHLRASAAPRLPLITVDQEGGRVQRLGRKAGFRPVPSARRLGQAGTAEARASYAAMAAELAEVGVNFNLGPVVDLAVNPQNPVIARAGRSYGADPLQVESFAAAFVEAHRAEGIATSAKHFPGHGSSREDTHHDFADVTASWAPAELAPYRALRAMGRLDAVMVAHVAHAQITGSRDRPASLSETAIEGHLRAELGAGTLVITDDLEMAAVRKRFAPEAAAVAAVKAGNDLLIFSNTWQYDPARAEKLTEAILAAMDRGEISPERIRRSHARLMRLRERIR